VFDNLGWVCVYEERGRCLTTLVCCVCVCVCVYVTTEESV